MGQEFFQFRTASVERKNLSIFSDENRAGDSVNSVVFGNRNRSPGFGLLTGNDSFTVKHLFPGNVVVFEEFIQSFFLFGIVTGNADDLKSFVVIGSVSLFDVWQFRAARTAPRCPEVNQNDFAGVVFRFVFGTVNERSAKEEFFT